MNDSLAAEPVDEIKDDLDFYLEAYADDPDFLESYDEEVRKNGEEENKDENEIGIWELQELRY